MSRPLFSWCRLVAALAGAASGLVPMVAACAAPPPRDAFSVVARPVIVRIRAPADEYFGRYRLSTLGVRNAIFDMTVEGDSPLALPLQVERIDAVTSALGDWAQRYPRDPWLPSSMVRFSTFLIGKQLGPYDRIAMALLDYLRQTQPGTWYARFASGSLERLDLHPQMDLLQAPWMTTPAAAIQRVRHALGARSR